MLGKFFRLILLSPLMVIGAILSLALIQPVIAAPPDGLVTIAPVAQNAGVTLEKMASSEVVTLGQIVTYTINIKNDRDTTITPELVDELPEGLSLLTRVVEGRQTTSISATLGDVKFEDRAIIWTGELEPGDEATIIYPAIPPSTSTPNQALQNVATLTVGETTLESAASISTQAPNLGLWRRFINSLAWILVNVNRVMLDFGVPYSFGFAIILFTLSVRLATFPLNMQQIKSSKAMQELQPKMKELQDKYKNDREGLAKAQMELYREHGVNPLSGCLPLLVQMPIWFALYRSLLQLSHEGLLRQGFFWIPSLSGPVSDYSGGLSWLWPLPPAVGWPSAIAYLILPVLLVVSQLYMQQMMTPPSTDPQQASMQSVMKFMPLMFGYFALIVPSGLTLYWFTSNLLAMAQQYFTKTQAEQEKAKAASNAAMVASPIPETPVSANSAPAGSTSIVSGEDENDKNGRKRKRSKKRGKR